MFCDVCTSAYETKQFPTIICVSFSYYSFLILQEKLQFYHVKVSNKLLHRNVEITPNEGLGSLPRDLDSVSSLLLFNTSENPYVFYSLLECGFSAMLQLSYFVNMS